MGKPPSPHPKFLASVLVMLLWIHLLSQTHMPCSRCVGKVEAAQGLGASSGGTAVGVSSSSLLALYATTRTSPTHTHDLGSAACWGGPSDMGIFPSEGGGPCGFLPG